MIPTPAPNPAVVASKIRPATSPFQDVRKHNHATYELRPATCLRCKVLIDNHHATKGTH